MPHTKEWTDRLIDLDEILNENECGFLKNGERVKVKLAIVEAVRVSLEYASHQAIGNWYDNCGSSDCGMDSVYNHVEDSILKTIDQLK